MSFLANYTVNRQVCIVCGECFWLFDIQHTFDPSNPTCSWQCNQEYHELMNALADEQLCPCCNEPVRTHSHDVNHL